MMASLLLLFEVESHYIASFIVDFLTLIILISPRQFVTSIVAVVVKDIALDNLFTLYELVFTFKQCTPINQCRTNIRLRRRCTLSCLFILLIF